MSDKDVTAKTCNVPGCQGKKLARGLCSKHYWQLKNKNPETRAEAEKYADSITRPGTHKHKKPAPSIAQKAAKLRKMRQQNPRKPRNPATPPADDAGDREPSQTKRSNWTPQEMLERISEERIAAVSEFASALGLHHTRHRGGLLFLTVAEDLGEIDKSTLAPLYISADGKLRYATLELSDRPA